MNSAQLMPTQRRKLSCACTADTREPSSLVTSMRIACVSPTKRSVKSTSGFENFASPLLNAADRHHALGTTSTIIPMTSFQMSGAVPIPTDEEPDIPPVTCRGMSAPSGKGHDQTARSPTSLALGSDSARKNSTRLCLWPAHGSRRRAKVRTRHCGRRELRTRNHR